MDINGVAWAAPPPNLVLPANEVHLWCGELDHHDHDLRVAEALLSADELRRAGRLYFERDRRRFVVGRALLRMILGRYLQREPSTLEFAYGEHGKPALRDPTVACHFNVSHSSNVALFAVSCERAVGVDVEHVRDMPDADQVAARFFAAPEARIVQALPYPAKTAAFFACWTRKEAYIKAIGAGLAYPLDSFAVSCLPDEQPRLMWVADNPQEVTRWSFDSFSPADAHLAAVVVEGPRPRQRRWRAPLLRERLTGGA